jgi:Peptidase A4 family
MARRWYVPLLAIPVAIGTVVAVLEGVASASPGLAHTAARTAAVQRIFPGSPMISPSGGALPGLRDGTVNTRISSANWAGYAVLGNRTGAFRSVSAGWTEPRANCKGVRGLEFSSFWVGLDGFSLNQSNRTVEQLGTDADCNGGTPVYFAWFETFPNPSVSLPRRVAPGDHMFASVTFRGGGRFALFIQDSTRHWSRTIVRTVARATRRSAEVIAEAPSLLIGGNFVVQNLADFGTVRWTSSRVNGILLKRYSSAFQITMVEANRLHPRVRATTSGISSTDVFTNTWVRAS